MPTVRLQPRRHKRVACGHPWIYSNEIVIDESVKAIEPGAMVRFCANDGTFLGAGSYNPHTLIAGRIFTREPMGVIDEAWLRGRVERALAFRDKWIQAPYYRVAHAESDGLPGLIVDRFGQYLSVQVNTAGMEKLWPFAKAALQDVLRPQAIVLHNESSVRALEKLERAAFVEAGELDGPVDVIENGLTYCADLIGGQKTGWYFDQRDNHALVARYARGVRVLDLYCHAGGFGLLAAREGAQEVLGVDASQPALDLAQQAALRNDLSSLTQWQRADVFEALESMIKAKQTYDLVIADPPPFVKSRKDLNSGARGYRKLTRLAAQATSKDGMLFLASCSHNMTLDLFTQEVAAGLFEARRQGRILHTVFAAPDHPVHPHLPESAYLKGFLIQMD